jgi:hypothetical protein
MCQAVLCRTRSQPSYRLLPGGQCRLPAAAEHQARAAPRLGGAHGEEHHDEEVRARARREDRQRRLPAARPPPCGASLLLGILACWFCDDSPFWGLLATSGGTCNMWIQLLLTQVLAASGFLFRNRHARSMSPLFFCSFGPFDRISPIEDSQYFCQGFFPTVGVVAFRGTFPGVYQACRTNAT